MYLLSIPIMHSSPYIYKSNQKVSESSITGHEFSFTNSNDDIQFVGDAPPDRYRNAIFGTIKSSRGLGVAKNIQVIDYEYNRGRVPFHFANQSLNSHYNSERYLTIQEREIKKNTQLYEGSGYSKSDYKYLNNNRKIDKIYDNRGFRLYIVE
ncbi:hypothetical protein GCM10009000_037270 [Halobacterium noricense]